MRTVRFLALMVIFGYSLARADVVLVPDFRVDQDPIPNSIAGVASSLTYGYFVVFYRYSTPPTYEGDLYARRFDLDGNPLADAFRVDSAPETAQTGGAGVIIDSNGNMVFGWTDDRTGASHVYFRRFDASENPLNSDTMADQGSGANGGRIATLPAGGFVITYRSGGLIYARIYDSTGTPIGNEFRVDQSGGDLGTPFVNTDPSGQIYFAWTFGNPGTAVYARLFDSSGNPLLDEFQVDQSPNMVVLSTIAAAPNGNFIVAWDDYREEGDFGMSDVFARAFDLTGTPFGDDFKVNSESTGENAAVANSVFAPSGRALFVWNDSRDGGAHYIRHIDSNGTILDNDSRLHSGVLGGYTATAAVGFNSFVTAWGDSRSGSNEVWANITGPAKPLVPTLPEVGMVVLFISLLAAIVLVISRRRSVYRQSFPVRGICRQCGDSKARKILQNERER